LEKLVDVQPDIASNLSQQDWRDIAAFVERYGRASPVGMTILLVRASLPDFGESQTA